MRVFWTAVIVAIIIAFVGSIGLARIQKPVSIAFSTHAVRL